MDDRRNDPKTVSLTNLNGLFERTAHTVTLGDALDFLIDNGLIHRIERMNAFVGCSHPGESHRGFFLICGECGNADKSVI